MTRRGGRATSVLPGLLVAALWGCAESPELALRREIDELKATLKERENRLAAAEAANRELNRQLSVARSISEDDLKRVFYPEKIEIDRLTGGFDNDGQPGDEGVVVYLRPIDRFGDVVKVPGDITIQLYDLAAPENRQFVGEYRVPVDKAGELWHGKLMTNHYTIKCPWPKAPPENPTITVRVVFVDYLTKRVVSAQSTCNVRLRDGARAASQPALE